MYDLSRLRNKSIIFILFANATTDNLPIRKKTQHI